jgi:uncharacterized membrane protein YbhN (UPF0104 family)
MSKEGSVNKKLRLLVSVALLGWLAWRSDWAQVGGAFGSLRLEYWLAGVVLYGLTQVVSAFRWQMLAQPLGFDQPLRDYTAFYFLGMYFNLFLPTSVGGDVVRAWYLDGGSGRRLAAFLSVVIDRLSGLLILLALACGAVSLCPIAVRTWIVGSVWGTAGCALLALLAVPLLAQWTHRFDRVRRLVEGVRQYLRRPALLMLATALSLAVQAANVVLVWLVGKAIAAPIPASYYWIVVPMVTLLTMLPVSLNGMGIREGGMVLFLAPLGVSEGTAVSLAFLWFSVFTATSLVGAGIYLFGNFSRPEERPIYGSLGGDSDQGRAGQSSAAA